jgi:cyclophilin family peptidyl-prolyl cis-trans isomerase
MRAPEFNVTQIGRSLRRTLAALAVTVGVGLSGLTATHAAPAAAVASGGQPSPTTAAGTLTASAAGAPAVAAAPSPLDRPGLYAEFTTPRGVITAELFFEQTPLTVMNFVGLAEGSLGPAPRRPFFDGLTFHRVVADFVVQGGDPLGNGQGGPGYEFPDEFRPGLGHDDAGILSMANIGPDTNGSQFFFTLRSVRRLDFLHSVFGRVVAGREVLTQIRQGDTMSVKIRRVGAAAETFRVDDTRFAQQVAATPKAKPPLFDDPSGLLPASPPRARAFAAKLANVERFTGLRLYVRIFARRDVEDREAKPDQIAERLARQFGAETNGMVATYFADRDEWALWIGDQLLPRFNPNGASLHDAKEAFMAGARGRAGVIIAELNRDAPPDSPLGEAQKLKLVTDEVIDGAIALLLAPTKP